MSYENPPLPEGINVTGHGVLAETLRLAAVVALVVALAGAVLYFGGGRLARLIPFSSELSWVGDTPPGIEVVAASDVDTAEIEAYLAGLAAQLAARMQLPEGMRIRVRYSASDAPNAFATLGGHIVVTRGLYRLMPSENALATVLAHEIAHVRARDPIAAIGGTATLALLVAVIGGDASGLAPQVARAVQLGYSRHAESLADAAAIDALNAHYGHAGGAGAVFEALADVHASTFNAPTLLSTHPLEAQRIERMRSAAAQWDETQQPLQPLRIAHDGSASSR